MRLSVIRCACLGLSLALVISAPVSATVYDAPPGAVPTSLLAGDVLNIGAGRSTTSSFTAATGSLINVVGGTVALSAAPLNSDANVYSGFFQPAQVNGAVNVYGGTADSFTFGKLLNVFGGSVGSGSLFFMPANATLNLYGGSVGNNAHVDKDTVNILGGTMGLPFPPFDAKFNMSAGNFIGAAFFGASVFNLSGGILTNPNLNLQDTSKMNITGWSFLLNGAPIPGLSVNNPVVITSRNVVLTGTLVDGANFTGNITAPSPGAGVATTATITVFLVPEPSTLGLIFISSFSTLVRRKRTSRGRFAAAL